MLSTTFLQAVLVLVAGAGVSLSKPVYPRLSVSREHFEVLALRASTSVNPDAVTDVKCIDPNVDIDFHDQNVAELSICGSIAGAVTRCEGAPESTVGESGSARFSLKAASEGATISISKGRWEQCVGAARAVCPTGSMAGTCAGGASKGDVEFVLDSSGSS
ncbi:hypothetical protein DL766_009297 [Monosporascus sp. MC13-8B]|uniref:AA1-like domain-containing protein n=1 Tax=Monosporascus cannonballus TaxID=155416 RepID=A0ABY0H9E3_9PEZI|nr:hypothetical protein DL762_003825 [Monosporascus cannonballus]RYO92818.1 hypothetical protein DL763_004543 [Monosporascus cannonballus]RYP15821.1 hypothetical protein DL766_009297 [Monosporascus sp. MC13-8B]